MVLLAHFGSQLNVSCTIHCPVCLNMELFAHCGSQSNECYYQPLISCQATNTLDARGLLARQRPGCSVAPNEKKTSGTQGRQPKVLGTNIDRSHQYVVKSIA